MKFALMAVKESLDFCDYPTEIVHTTKTKMSSRGVETIINIEYPVVEINTIEDLVSLCKKFGEDIIFKPNAYKNHGQIIIYNDYYE